jgi:hypothetical protein
VRNSTSFSLERWSAYRWPGLVGTPADRLFATNTPPRFVPQHRPDMPYIEQHRQLVATLSWTEKIRFIHFLIRYRRIYII